MANDLQLTLARWTNLAGIPFVLNDHVGTLTADNLELVATVLWFNVFVPPAVRLLDLRGRCVGVAFVCCLRMNRHFCVLVVTVGLTFRLLSHRISDDRRVPLLDLLGIGFPRNFDCRTISVLRVLLLGLPQS